MPFACLFCLPVPYGECSIAITATANDISASISNHHQLMVFIAMERESRCFCAGTVCVYFTEMSSSRCTSVTMRMMMKITCALLSRCYEMAFSEKSEIRLCLLIKIFSLFVCCLLNLLLLSLVLDEEREAVPSCALLPHLRATSRSS